METMQEHATEIYCCAERERERGAARTASGDCGPLMGPICATERREEGAVSQMNRAGDVQAEPSPADITEWEK